MGQTGQRQFSVGRGQGQSQRGAPGRGPTTFIRPGGPAGRGQTSRGQMGRPQTRARVLQQPSDISSGPTPMLYLVDNPPMYINWADSDD